MRYLNPVIKGFHPDPSICRVQDDFYLVTSSFEFFPGVPIFHSKNLVNWECIGHCLSRKEQLLLEGELASGGVWAPTLRYHEGQFYLITTIVRNGWDISRQTLVRAENPAGPWSDPVLVEFEGIDPSLLFDDGKVYYCSTGNEKKGKPGIFAFELDIVTGKKMSEPVKIGDGMHGEYAEGPHLYKIGDYYYQMSAEGGTSYGHCETISRSRNIYGPYEQCPHNPILSNSYQVIGQPVHAVGHGDLVEDQNGNWWLVCLGIRARHDHLHHLGRETFLAPVTWDEEGWPHVGENKHINLEMAGPLQGPVQTESYGLFTDFREEQLNNRFTFIRNPVEANYFLSNGLTLEGNGTTLSDAFGSPTFMGVRQAEFNIRAHTVIIDAENDYRGGISAYYSDSYHYDLIIEKRMRNHSSG